MEQNNIYSKATFSQPDVNSKKSPAYPASRLTPQEKHDLSIQVLAGVKPVSHISKEMEVSRKFLYQQAKKADTAILSALSKKEKDSDVLFYLPVTRLWLKQFIIALVFLCHSSFRGIIELLSTVFDYHDISLGSIHNIVSEAYVKAKAINATEDYSKIRHISLDELFQSRKPVLAGVDLDSNYCFLLSAEDHRDETTWGVHLLDCAEKGLNPEYTIADFGKGLRAGHAAAWEDVPCFGDVFHAVYEFQKLSTFLTNRAFHLLSASENIDSKMEKAKVKKQGQALSKKSAIVHQKSAQAIQLADDVNILLDWMKNDILAMAGPPLSERSLLYDFVLKELRSRESLCPHRIKPIMNLFQRHKEDLLAFAKILDEQIVIISKELNVQPQLTYAIANLQVLDRRSQQYWQQENQLRKKLGSKYHDLKKAVHNAIDQTHRSSSLVENFNSRLRNYFFLRKHISNNYLELLRFFLNHHRFIRSEHGERVGKSPAELMTGNIQPHWLEMLGFQMFKRN